jgi:hypothetical protein
MLYAKLISNLTSVQDSLLRPVKIVARAVCTLIWLSFFAPLIACGVNEWQDLMTRINISCGLLSCVVITVTWSHYQSKVIQRLLSPTMTNTLNEAQRHERQRAAKALRDYMVHTATSLSSNAIGMAVMLSWYWLRARLTYWGAVTTISFSMMALRSVRTYGPHRVVATQTIGVTPPKHAFGTHPPTAAAAHHKDGKSETVTSAQAIAIAIGNNNSNKIPPSAASARSGTPSGLVGRQSHALLSPTLSVHSPLATPIPVTGTGSSTPTPTPAAGSISSAQTTINKSSSAHQ